MKHCDDHEASIKAAIDQRGMTKLIPQTREDAFVRTVRFLQGNPSPDSFDPLSAMGWTFMQRIAEILGVGVFMERPAGDDGMPENRDKDGIRHYCPLCIVRRDFEMHNNPSGKCDDPNCHKQVKPGDKPFDQLWIDGCADDMLEHAVGLGLMGMVGVSGAVH